MIAGRRAGHRPCEQLVIDKELARVGKVIGLTEDQRDLAATVGEWAAALEAPDLLLNIVGERILGLPRD